MNYDVTENKVSDITNYSENQQESSSTIKGTVICSQRL